MYHRNHKVHGLFAGHEALSGEATVINIKPLGQAHQKTNTMLLQHNLHSGIYI
jgi:hypothetical protein